MKKIFLLLVLLISKTLFSQTLPEINIDSTLLPEHRAVCGYSPSMFANPNLRIAVGGGVNPAAMPKGNYPANAIFDCGRFRLYYEDVALANGIGFDAGAGVGATRRNTLCLVYQYIQSVFDFNNIPVGDPITIEIEATPAAGAFTFLAVAGPVYPNSALPGIYNGSVFNHVLTGASPNLALFDGTLTVNFNSFNFHDNPANPIPNCSYDLFSVLLHEVGHQLGFGSLLREDASQNPVSAFGNNQYTLFDWQNIWHGNINTPATFEKLVTGTLASPQINPAIASPTNYLRDERLWLNNNGRFLNNIPIYSGIIVPGFTFLNINSVASHIDGEYVSFTKRFCLSPGFMKPHSMQPYFDFGELRREFTEQEIRIFLQLGYNLNPAYAISNSINGIVQNQLIINNNRPPYTTKQVTNLNVPAVTDNTFPDLVQVADFTIANNGTPLTINLATDPTLIDLDGDQITVENNTLYNIRGCGNGNNHAQLSVNAAGNIITFTPRPDFIGRAQFGFYLTDGMERGSFMVYTIDVANGPAFNNIANINTPAGFPELVINGGFEQGMELRRNSSLPEEFIFNSSLQFSREEGLYFTGNVFADAHPLQYLNWLWTSSNGIIVGNSQKECIQPTTPGRFGARPFSYPNPIWNNPPSLTGNRYSFILGGHNYSTLSQPLQQCQRYEARFDVNFSNTGLVAGSNYSFNLVINNVVVFPTNPATQTIPVNITVGAGWQTIIVPFTYCSATPGNFINFVSTTGTKVYYDNVSLIEIINPPPTLNVSITNSIPSYCFGSGSSSTLTGTATNVLCNATYSWMPGGATTASITVSPTTTTTYTLTVNDGCRTSTATTTVTVNPLPVVTVTPSAPTITAGGSIGLVASGASTYTWLPTTGLSCTSCSNPIASPTTTTTYTVTGTDANGCSNTATVTVTVNPLPTCPATNIMAASYSTNTTLSAGGFWAPSVVNTTITGGATLTLSAIQLRMPQNSKITVTPGCTLKIINATQIWACNDDMWDGIDVQAGGRIEMFGDSRIEDAKIAVHILNSTTTEAQFFIHHSTFNKNHKAIVVEPYPNTHNGVVYSTLFTSAASTLPQLGTLGGLSTLKNPYAFLIARKANMGVEIRNVKAITIGSTLGQNTFNNLEVGIHSFQNTFLYSKNNKFQNITYGKTCPSLISACFLQSTTGMGIWAEELGTIVVGGSTPDANTFMKCNNGIVARQDINVFVSECSFNQITQASLFTSSTAILVENDLNNQTIRVNNNTFNNFRDGVVVRNYYKCYVDINNNDFKNFPKGLGVYCLQNTGSLLNILNNQFNSTGIDNGATAIRVQNAVITGNGPVNIYTNVIRNCVTGVMTTNIQKPQIASQNNIRFNLSSPPAPTNYGVRVQNCPGSYVNDNDVYKQGATTAGSAFNNKLYAYTFDVGCVSSSITNNYARRMNTGFRFSGSNNATLIFGCNYIQNNYTGLELNTTDIGNQGAVGSAQDNQWSLPNPSTYLGTYGAKNTASVIPVFYTRGGTTPWGLLPGQQFNTGGGIAVSFTTTTGSGYYCLYGCANPPCMHTHIAKVAKKQAPFDSLSTNNKDITYFNTYYLLKQDSSLYQQGTPDDAIIVNFKDSLAYTNIGYFYEVSEKAMLGDTVNAKMINNAVVPKDCKDQSQKIVNKIFLSTWARGIFELNPADSTALQIIADYNVEDCGIAVYDARVMLRYDKDDFYDLSRARINPYEQIAERDNYGIMYPNPANTRAIYEIELSEKESGFVQLCDLLGNMLSVKKLTEGNNKTEFDLSEFANGIYIYKVYVNDELKVSDKLVISK